MSITLTNYDSIIFLDVGVLHRKPTEEEKDKLNYYVPSSQSFDSDSLKHFDTLLKTQKASIVITSPWKKDKTVDQIKDLLENHSFSACIIDKTHDFMDDVDFKSDFTGKARAIHYWLSTHPTVKHFVVLDCENSGLSKAFPDHFIQVHARCLLNRVDMQKAKELLIKPTINVREVLLAAEQIDDDYERFDAYIALLKKLGSFVSGFEQSKLSQFREDIIERCRLLAESFPLSIGKIGSFRDIATALFSINLPSVALVFIKEATDLANSYPPSLSSINSIKEIELEIISNILKDAAKDLFKEGKINEAQSLIDQIPVEEIRKASLF